MAKAEADSTSPGQSLNGASPSLLLPKPKARRRLRKIDAAPRRRIEDAVEHMIEVLDAIEASSEDLEDDGTAEEDNPAEDDGTAEPSSAHSSG